MDQKVPIGAAPSRQGANASATPRGRRRRLPWAQVPIHLVLALMVVLVMLPFLWMALGSFKTYPDLINNPNRLPDPFTTENYQEIFGLANFTNAFINSVIVAAFRTVTACITSLMLGYVFAKYHFFGKNALYLLLLSTMLVPFPSVMVALYLRLSELHLLNQLSGLIAVAVFSTFGTLILRQWISGIPNELIDAARLDGAGELRIIASIIAPLSAPPLGALAVFTFLISWDDYLFPSIVLTDPNTRTLPLALAGLKSLFWERYELFCAGAMITVVPVMLLYAFMQNHFVRGMTFMGGVKG